jgi:tRNA threonylcarbamoyladenosine biosynthesis protein TsaB
MNSKKIILALDTVLGNSVALMIGEKIYYPNQIPDEEHKKSAVILKIDSLLQQHSIKIEDLTAIGLNIGPGSFTGIRIGIALVKGFARPFDVPVVPANSFQAISRMIGLNENCTIIINAGGGFVYIQNSNNSDDNNTPDNAHLINIDSLENYQLQKSVILYGTGLEKTSEKLSVLSPECDVIESDSPIIDSIVNITHEALGSGYFINYKDIKPYYIKPSYADLI